MTYFDPEVYDPSKLKGDDAIEMRGFDWCAEQVENAFDNLTFDGDSFGRIKSEIADEVKDEVLRFLDSSRIELTAAMMEGDETYWDAE